MTSVEVHMAFLLALFARVTGGLSPSARAQVLAAILRDGPGTAQFDAGACMGPGEGSAMQTPSQASFAADRQRWAKGLLLGRPREPD